MGQAFSSGNSLYVHLDRPHYFPGDVVNGFVLLNCVSQFKASTLVLKVEGYEKTSWEERIEERRHDSHKNEWVTDVRSHNHNGRKDFFNLKVPLQTFPQFVQPGQYQYGFTFMIPPGLPGSYEFNDGSFRQGPGCTYYYTKAAIKYKVGAEVEVPGMLTPNIRHDTYLTVHQRMLKPPSQVRAEDNKHIKTCCCMDQGYAHMVAHVQQDSYYAGEVAHVVLGVENKSQAAFREIILELKRHLVLRSSGGMMEQDDQLAKTSFPGVQPGDVAIGGDARVLSLQLPINTQPTALGHLVHCEYRLHITLKAEGTFTSDAKLKVPVAIYSPAIDYTAYSAPPPYWQPQVVMPAVQLAVPSAPPMAPMPQAMADLAYLPPQPTYGGPSAPPAPSDYPKI